MSEAHCSRYGGSYVTSYAGVHAHAGCEEI
jgi:hypothetical protein